uniref:Transmembrane protein n=1 Tax=Triparma pacifica TaxID=91992 RepID=A0A7S2VWC2_9STRA|mmetsp:Transcript_1718/g.3259  ORF Transcript_1718/g.3259 Transcript_1718/m.3259 type:complete len:136 (+) Transcript_1718:455-862(+)
MLHVSIGNFKPFFTAARANSSSASLNPSITSLLPSPPRFLPKLLKLVKANHQKLKFAARRCTRTAIVIGVPTFFVIDLAAWVVYESIMHVKRTSKAAVIPLIRFPTRRDANYKWETEEIDQTPRSPDDDNEDEDK